MGKRIKTNRNNGDGTKMCLRERKDRERDVQRARNGTWDIMSEKKDSETEEPVRRLATSRETWDTLRQKKESETEEPLRRLGTSNRTWDFMREKKESETEEPVRSLAPSKENTRESSGNSIDFERPRNQENVGLYRDLGACLSTVGDVIAEYHR